MLGKRLLAYRTHILRIIRMVTSGRNGRYLVPCIAFVAMVGLTSVLGARRLLVDRQVGGEIVTGRLNDLLFQKDLTASRAFGAFCPAIGRTGWLYSV